MGGIALQVNLPYFVCLFSVLPGPAPGRQPSCAVKENGHCPGDRTIMKSMKHSGNKDKGIFLGLTALE